MSIELRAPPGMFRLILKDYFEAPCDNAIDLADFTDRANAEVCAKAHAKDS